MLTALQPGDILFIDEIHRLHPAIEETMYSALEDFRLDIIIGEGPSAKSVRLDLPRFTLVGATTRAGMLTSPMRDRFGIAANLEYYGDEDMRAIVARSARILGVPVEKNGVSEIARRARRTPRIANRLLRRTRDFAEVEAQGTVTEKVAQDALDLLEVDHAGLDSVDKKIPPRRAGKIRRRTRGAGQSGRRGGRVRRHFGGLCGAVSHQGGFSAAHSARTRGGQFRLRAFSSARPRIPRRQKQTR